MFGNQEVANAEDLVVSATIPATIPVEAAVLLSPESGTIVTKPVVTINGTCPVVDPAVIIQLLEGTAIAASGACESDGTFTITATITKGKHLYRLGILTVTNGVGQESPAFDITYSPPASPVDPEDPVITPPEETPLITSEGESEEADPGVSTDSPLLIDAEKDYMTFGQYSPAVWKGRIMGGTPYYNATIDWGDNSVESLKNINTEIQEIPHTYLTKGPFTAVITATDQLGATYTASYAAISMTDFEALSSTTGTVFTQGLSQETAYKVTMYGSFSAALLVTLLLWRVEQFHTLAVSAVHFYSNSHLRHIRHLYHKK